jgi:hypothetical protein
VLFTDGIQPKQAPRSDFYKKKTFCTHQKAKPTPTYDFCRFYYKKEDDIAPFKNQSNEYVNFSGLNTVTGYIRTFKTNKKTTNCAHQKAKAIATFTFQVLIKMNS